MENYKIKKKMKLHCYFLAGFGIAVFNVFIVSDEVLTVAVYFLELKFIE